MVQKIENYKAKEFNQKDYERFLQNKDYIFVPRGGIFEEIHLPARVLYGMMLDKLRYDGIEGTKGRKMIHYSINEMAADTGYHRGHIIRLLRELQDHNLIQKKFWSPEKPVDIYVNPPEYVQKGSD